ncbi:phage_term_2, phage terminase, large subunit, PBSX family [uncultured Caudovirales phage]|jgi:PBSX family phage terminase large subunit|uniref:Phage_term_2, phage terminase, large subunit, PBSX family n=1 Tax=uncultured Caudovirales phage TaxID=2100421 RepID=A0A6J5KZK4_9CAUD|nr:phage_term_2, phage terminase, large subunit, PBSX family [uncultured Caudovirales phage]
MEKFSRKQLDFFHNANARINIAAGAVRSGKSYILLLRFMRELREGPEGAYLVTGKSERTVLMNVIEPLQHFTNGAIRYNRGMGEFHLFGKKVYVVGANDERAEGKIRGATFAGALVDEVTILPPSYFKMLLSRLSVPGAKLFGGTNPDSPLHWLKVEFLDKFKDDPEQLKTFHFDLDDNPILTDQFKNALKKEYQGLWYKRFILGDWVLAEGAIFDYFDTKIHIVKEPPTYAKYHLVGIDYGTNNPFAGVVVGFNDDHKPSLWVEKEYYWDSKAMGSQKTDSEYAIGMEYAFNGYTPRLYYLDPSAASFEVELKRLKKPVKQAKNDVLDGIRFMSKLLSEGNLVICQSCKNLIKEIEGYVWDERAVLQGEDKPLKQRDHAIDAVRYALFSHFGQRTTLKETSREDAYQMAEQKKFAQNPMAYPGYTNSAGWQRY